MGSHLTYSGLVIALTGFLLTRFTVTLAIYEDPVSFYFAGVVPLLLGLGLAAFGVALAVADVDPELVRTTAVWCVVGAATMFVLVVLTLLGSPTDGMADLGSVRSQTYLSNFLIGGSIGGTLTGLYAARNRRQRAELHHQANRLEVLNRLLRHEVLNAVTVIRGYAGLEPAGDPDNMAVIEGRSDDIEHTIDEVTYLTRSADAGDAPGGAIDVASCLEGSVANLRGRHPDAAVSLDVPPGTPTVRANERLERVLTHLLENAVVHADGGASPVAVSVAATPSTVRISVSDDGPGLPESRQALLERGEIDEFDNPRMGFGLNLVRLYVESFRGAIETDVDDDGTTVTVVLPRAAPDVAGLRADPTGLTGVRPALPHLVVTLVASLVAGVVYGVAAEQLGGSVSIIGVLYGVESVVVGWITHEFHSVVFGFIFAGLVSLAPERYRAGIPGYVAIGLGWGLVLWFVAAGFISSIWLRLIGIPVPIPSLSVVTLGAHLAWGVSLGVLLALGYAYVTPVLDRFGGRLRGQPPVDGEPY